MRRTRHVALPVRAWQYVGLLIVSLACLTLGLVSRDKEGRAGSLAGPELEHRAPHEVDACPNLNPFTKMPLFSTLRQDETRVLKPSANTRISRSNLTPIDTRISRSQSLDRLSEARLDSRRNFLGTDRLVRQKRSIDVSRRTLESRFRTRNEDRTSSRRSSDPTVRLSRSQTFDDVRFVAQSLDRRSRSTERRLPAAFDRRQNRETVERRASERREHISRLDNRLDFGQRNLRSTERREQSRLDNRFDSEQRNLRSTERREHISRLDNRLDSRQRNLRSTERRDTVLNRQARHERTNRFNRLDVRQHTSQAVERRERTLDRQTRRENQLETEKHRFRTLDRRGLSLDRRANEKRENTREDRQRLLNRAVSENRMNRRVEDRQSPARVVRENRLNSEENRRNIRSIQDDRQRSRYSVSRDQDRRSVIRTTENARQLDSRSSRSFERTLIARVSTRQSRPLERQNSRNVDRFADQKLSKRSMDVERRERNRLQSRVNEASRERDLLVRSRELRSTDTRTNRNDRTATNNDRRNRVQVTMKRDSRFDIDRLSIGRTEQRERTNERREKINRLDRHLSSRMNVRRDSSTIKSLERTKVDDLEQRERLDRLNLARESRDSRIRLARISEASRRDLEQRRTRNLSNDRRSERRALVNSNRSSERRSTVLDSLNREEVRADRRVMQERINRQGLDSSLRQRLDISRLQRTRATIPASDRTIQREQRLTDRTRVPLAASRGRTLIDTRRSRSVDLARFSDKDLDTQLFRASVVSPNTRLFTRARILDVPSFTRQKNFMKDDLTLEVIRQAFIIGLCAIYGLSMFSGKRSFISNVVRQAPRFIVW
ncbi:uncharacterized protein LOC143183846 [Calliopsis andreniformis]|uniref:uncharacterized protein LOC143183846 n=1 Tax=Calliopsis andreniformis TaxID=337506 RepID=UPI003FCD88E8